MTVRRLPPETSLQVFLGLFRELMQDARTWLGPREWVAFVSILCDAIGHEAANVAIRELLERDDEAAA